MRRITIFRKLIEDDRHLSPEDRYLMLSLYVEVASNRNRTVDVSSCRLVSDFGATTKVVKKVVDVLANQEGVKLVYIFRQGRRLMFSQGYADRLIDEWLGIPVWKRDRILGLFTPAKREMLIPKKSKETSSEVIEDIKLRNSNLLLMFIFIYHSNDIGLVDGLTQKNIENMMGGISKDRLKSQIKSLRMVGFFRAERAGGTSKRYFKKLNNRYMIKLLHLNDECEFNGVNILGVVSKFVRGVGTKQRVYMNNMRHAISQNLDVDSFGVLELVMNAILRNVEGVIALNLLDEELSIALNVIERKIIDEDENLLCGGDGEEVAHKNEFIMNIKKTLSLKNKISPVELKVMFYFLVLFSRNISKDILIVLNEFYESVEIDSIKDVNVMFHDLVYSRNGNLFSYKCAIDFKLNEQPVIIDIDAERIDARTPPYRYQYILKSKGLTLKCL